MVPVVLVVTDEWWVMSDPYLRAWVELQNMIFRCWPVGLVHVHWDEKLQVSEYIEPWTVA